MTRLLTSISEISFLVLEIIQTESLKPFLGNTKLFYRLRGFVSNCINKLLTVRLKVQNGTDGELS